MGVESIYTRTLYVYYTPGCILCGECTQPNRRAGCLYRLLLGCLLCVSPSVSLSTWRPTIGFPSKSQGSTNFPQSPRNGGIRPSVVPPSSASSFVHSIAILSPLLEADPSSCCCAAQIGEINISELWVCLQPLPTARRFNHCGH
jgi:hypothetical protein